MPRPRSLVLTLAAALTLATVALPASAARSGPKPGGRSAPTAVTSSALPEDALLFDSNRTGTYELWRVGLDGTGAVQLTDDPAYDSWWPKLSPDRRRVVFYRTPAGVHDRDYTRTSLWAMDVDGSNLRELIPVGGHGWELHGHAEWSPDGTELVMFGGRRFNPRVYVTDAAGRAPREVTARGGMNLDPSWTPDGRILFVGCPTRFCVNRLLEVYVIDADGTDERRLTHDGLRDHDPYASPDGQTIAWLRQMPVGWSIQAMDADGHGHRAVIDDGAVNSKPAWSSDSSTILFHRRPLDRLTFSLWSIRPDGSGLHEIVPRRRPVGYVDEYPVASSY